MDIYQEVTNRIIKQLENGVIPWKKPWIGAGASNAAISHSTGEPYSLLNQIMLGKPGEYITFSQVKKEGGKVRKGEKAQIVVFWRWIEKEDEQNPEEPKKIPLLRYYNVFHLDQCDGIKPRHETPAELPNTVNPDAKAEKIASDYLKRTSVTLIHQKGDRAFYRPNTDSITLPLIEQFREVAEYYGTLFHEITHSTGHKSRLNRLHNVAAFGSEEYSKEELVAEIGSAALVNFSGLETERSFENSASYIQSWLKALKEDKNMIVSAAGKADKAVKLILGDEE